MIEEVNRYNYKINDVLLSIAESLSNSYSMLNSDDSAHSNKGLYEIKLINALVKTAQSDFEELKSIWSSGAYTNNYECDERTKYYRKGHAIVILEDISKIIYHVKLLKSNPAITEEVQRQQDRVGILLIKEKTPDYMIWIIENYGAGRMYECNDDIGNDYLEKLRYYLDYINQQLGIIKRAAEIVYEY